MSRKAILTSVSPLDLLWVDDADYCMACFIEFGAISTRIQCRACGSIICTNCSLEGKPPFNSVCNNCIHVTYICKPRLGLPLPSNGDSPVKVGYLLKLTNPFDLESFAEVQVCLYSNRLVIRRKTNIFSYYIYISFVSLSTYPHTWMLLTFLSSHRSTFVLHPSSPRSLRPPPDSSSSAPTLWLPLSHTRGVPIL